MVGFEDEVEIDFFPTVSLDNYKDVDIIVKQETQEEKMSRGQEEGQGAVHWVAKSRTQLRDFHFTSLQSVQFSHSFMSYSLRSHGLHNIRSPCPSPTPGVYSTSLSR